jgi:hypothetical protein
MKSKGFINIFIILLLLVLFIAAISFFYFFRSGKLQWNSGATPVPTSTALISETSTPVPSPTVKPGWKVYKNEKYGFEISYPEKYKALDDKENLYGWPDAIVLFYDGGQSYDVAVEVWNSQAEYQEKYVLEDNLTVKEVKGKFITLFNITQEEGTHEIIASFKAD